MNFSLALLMAVVASAATPNTPKTGNSRKTRYLSNLIHNSRPLRKLDEEFGVNISGYSLKFEKCQFVRMYDDEVAQDRTSTSVLGTNRFAIFRLCPNNNCESCNYNYGEYVLELERYLSFTVQYFQEIQQETCSSCQQWCATSGENDGNRRLQSSEQAPENVDCNSCVEECAKLQDMESQGLVDATKYITCTEIYQDSNSGASYYAAPFCTSDGDKVKIGIFSDENCNEYITSNSADDLMEVDENGNQKKLSYNLLKKTYSDTCISCLEGKNNNENADNGNGDEVSEVCANIYHYAGKCELEHGFENGIHGVQGYENQYSQENVVCQYIKSLKSGTYDETGEIDLTGESFSIGTGSTTTPGQIVSLAVFAAGTVALAIYAGFLHSKLTRSATYFDGSFSGSFA